MESQAHASEMGDPIIADELGEEYSLWAATAQIQLLSTVTHEPEHMKKHMGMGAPHRLSMLPVVTKQPPEYMHAERRSMCCAMSVMLSRHYYMRAAGDIGQHMSTALRGLAGSPYPLISAEMV